MKAGRILRAQMTHQCSDEDDALKAADQWLFDLHKVLGTIIEGRSMLIQLEGGVMSGGWGVRQSCKFSQQTRQLHS